MRISGNRLPDSFLEVIRLRRLQREVGVWELKDRDAYGDPLECDVGEVYGTEELLQEATEALPADFEVDDCYGQDSEWKDSPGFVENIVDFSSIVAFGRSGDGAPFVFDFRTNPAEPEILWWDDVYWRRLSPSFLSFMDLLQPE